MPSRLQIARPDIQAFFLAGRQRVFTLQDISHVLETNRANWRLAKSTSANAAQAKTLLAEAKKLASQVPINDRRASDKEVTGAFKSKSGLKAQIETEWEIFARTNYEKAKEQANKAAAMAR